MLNHEWTRQRDRRILQATRDTRPAEGEEPGEGLADDGYSANDLAALEEAEALAERQVAEALELVEAEAPAELEVEVEVAVPVAEDEPVADLAEEAEEPVAPEAAAPEVLVAVEPEAETPEAEPEPEPAAEAVDRQAVVAGLEVPLTGLRERLQAVLARQAQLPLDIDARRDVTEQVDGSPRETRELLVRRLLDPTLTLEETAVLLGVCPTTVRRYTNRGVLACYRTPGNQRRFHLTDILDFMERQSAPRS